MTTEYLSYKIAIVLKQRETHSTPSVSQENERNKYWKVQRKQTQGSSAATTRSPSTKTINK